MNNETKVISEHGAIVRGKKTGLSGCDTMTCPRRSECLRAHPLLSLRDDYGRAGAPCTFFISNK